MKNLLLTLIIGLSFSFAFAQSLELYYEGNLLDPNEEITITGLHSASEIVIEDIDVKNVSSDTLYIKVKKVIIDTIAGTLNDFCWAEQCYLPNTYISVSPAEIIPNGNSDSFSGHYRPDNHVGISIIQYVFFDQDNINDSVSMVVNFNATLTDVNEIFDYDLSNAYPNPANTFTKFDYSLSGVKNARLVIYNLLGTVVNETIITDNSGNIKISTSELDEGIYFYSLLINNETLKTQKLIIKH
ncbi:MAG: T9SS type A sorting domain-containing protein [Bacteroidales bacterium]|nr:T9SS type A sorting domain-containing protein [Bacteroidales bacterium]